MSESTAAIYDKERARTLLDGVMRFGGVTHRDLARVLALSPSRLSHKLGFRYPYDRLSEDEITAVSEFLDLKPAQREMLMECFGHRGMPEPGAARLSAPSPADAVPPARLDVTAAAGTAPPDPTADRPIALPVTLTSFVGRDAETETVAAALASTRLLTLVGPGGAGKTRLAVEVARRGAASYPDGVWLVELAPLGDAAAIGSTIATALGLQVAPVARTRTR